MWLLCYSVFQQESFIRGTVRKETSTLGSKQYFDRSTNIYRSSKVLYQIVYYTLFTVIIILCFAHDAFLYVYYNMLYYVQATFLNTILTQMKEFYRFDKLNFYFIKVITYN